MENFRDGKKTKNASAISGFNLFSNYQIVAYRNFAKNKLTTILNATGLTLGIACLMFICLYVYNEYNFDREVKGNERIYRVVMNWRSTADKDEVRIGMSLTPLAGELRESFSEVQSATAITPLRKQAIVTVGTKVFKGDRILETDTSFFNVFEMRPVSGVLSGIDPVSSIVLTEQLAKKYFGSEDPLQQTLIINDNSYTVIAVVKDVPLNSTVRFDALLFTLGQYSTDWSFTFFKLRQGAGDINNLQNRINQIFADEYQNYMLKTESTGTYLLERLTDIHFGPARLYDGPKGNLSMLYALLSIALLILIISCVNYVNLFVATSATRQVEVGMRKILGAASGHVRMQFAIEFFAVAVVCVILSGMLIAISWGAVTENGNLQIDFNYRTAFVVAIILITVLLGVSVLCGGYAASQITSSSLMDNLQRKAGFKGNGVFRNALLVFQYTVSISLIFASVVVMNQMGLISGSGNAVKINQIMVIGLPEDESQRISVAQIKGSLSQLSYINNISFTGYHSLPTQEPEYEIFEVDVEHWRKIKTVAFAHVDENFFKTLNIKLTSGRTFTSQELESEEDWNAPVVNEAFVKDQGWTDDPLQHYISFGERKGKGSRIIGVVHDFGFHGFHKKAVPMIFFPNIAYPEKVMVQFQAMDAQKLSEVGNVWQREVKASMNYRFLDDYFREVVLKEKSLQHLLLYFSIICITIASLGLFGLIHIGLVQQKKATALRLVYGADTINLLILTWKGYFVLFLAAILLAYPISYLALTNWLEAFPDKTAISILLYFKSVLVISTLIVGAIIYHAFKIRNAKYLTWIRYE